MIRCRSATDEERPFVIDTWLASFRTSYAAGLISMGTWREVMWGEIERILARAATTTLIAYPPDDHAFAYGWICADVTARPRVLHGAYTKATYRRGRELLGAGVFSTLLAAVGIDPREKFFYATKTPITTKLAEKYPFARWNPLPTRFGDKPYDDLANDNRPEDR
jgi:hypothetical protein